MRKLLAFLVFFFLTVLFVLTFLSREFLLPKQSEKKSVGVVIAQGMQASEVAAALDELGLIRHGWSFELLLRFTKTGGKIVAGTYDFSPSMSEYEILKALVGGRSVLVRVMIPEGYDLRQIAQVLDSDGVVPKDDFLSKTAVAVFELPDVEGKIEGMEGFLFPDTYDLEPHTSVELAVKPMLERFHDLVVPLFLKSKTQLSLREVITLASMVEREGKVQKELPLIAAVYINRLKDHLPLQCDATVQYLFSEPKEILGESDLKIDSPYNTYLHEGLPPGPIGNPGLAAIQAALHPAHVAYRYYVLQGKGGRHAFSVTYDQHLLAVQKYRQWLLHRKQE